MELINLKRLLTPEIESDIEKLCKEFAGEESYKIDYGHLKIGDNPLDATISTKVIINIVCGFYNVPRDLVLSRTRKRPIVTYRQIIMFFADKYTDLHHVAIGEKVGIWDRNSIRYGIQTIQNLIETDSKVRDDISLLDIRLKKIVE